MVTLKKNKTRSERRTEVVKKIQLIKKMPELF